MDPYLQHIATAAEREKWLPQLRIVAGNTLFVGTPGPSRSFRERSQYALAEEHFNSHAKGLSGKKAKEAAFQDAQAHGETAVAHLANAVSGADSTEVLTLHDCQVWPASGGDGVKISMVRIPLSSVDGWWSGAGELLKAPGGGGWAFGFGAVIPIDGLDL